MINIKNINILFSQVLVDYGYVWDSSVSVPPTKVPIWPYTLDYAIPHECRSGTCPTRSFPGLTKFPNRYFCYVFWFLEILTRYRNMGISSEFSLRKQFRRWILPIFGSMRSTKLGRKWHDELVARRLFSLLRRKPCALSYGISHIVSAVF